MLTSSQPSLPREDASRLACETFAACSQNCCQRVTVAGAPPCRACAGGGGGLSAQPIAAAIARIGAHLGRGMGVSVSCLGAGSKAPCGARCPDAGSEALCGAWPGG